MKSFFSNINNWVNVKNLYLPIFCLVVLVILLHTVSSCRKEKKEVVEGIPVYSVKNMYYNVARFSGNIIEEPRSDSKTTGLVLQGDELTILEHKGDWIKVMVNRTRHIGWIFHSFVQTSMKSKWWSGDTEKARNIAKLIFQDKRMNYYPIEHVRVEECFNKVVFMSRKDADFPKDKALEFIKIWLPFAKEYFPAWSEHILSLNASTNNKPYQLVTDDSGFPKFLQ